MQGHHIGMYLGIPYECKGKGWWVTLLGFPGERSHTLEERENVRTKDREQHQHFVNLDESE